MRVFFNIINVYSNKYGMGTLLTISGFSSGSSFSALFESSMSKESNPMAVDLLKLSQTTFDLFCAILIGASLYKFLISNIETTDRLKENNSISKI